MYSKNTNTSISNSRFTFISIIPFIILLLIATGLFLAFTNFNTPNHTALFSQYYTYKNPPDHLLTNENKFAFSSYLDRQHNNASNAFESLLNKENSSFEIALFTGLNYIESKQYIKASNIFNWLLLQNINNEDKNTAIWYNALVHLQLNDLKKCKNLLIELINNNTSYKQQAQNLLDDLL